MQRAVRHPKPIRDPMTPEEQRIAIAEACGWKWYRRPATGPWAAKPHRALYHPILSAELVSTLQPATMTERQCNDSFIWREGFIPDYPNDLNAMREVEDSIPIFKRGFYNAALSKCAVNDRNLSSTIRDPDWIFQLLHASASQRAEAFLKTIGKWSG